MLDAYEFYYYGVMEMQILNCYVDVTCQQQFTKIAFYVHIKLIYHVKAVTVCVCVMCSVVCVLIII